MVISKDEQIEALFTVINGLFDKLSMAKFDGYVKGFKLGFDCAVDELRKQDEQWFEEVEELDEQIKDLERELGEGA